MRRHLCKFSLYLCMTEVDFTLSTSVWRTPFSWTGLWQYKRDPRVNHINRRSPLLPPNSRAGTVNFLICLSFKRRGLRICARSISSVKYVPKRQMSKVSQTGGCPFSFMRHSLHHEAGQGSTRIARAKTRNYQKVDSRCHTIFYFKCDSQSQPLSSWHVCL